MRRYSQVQWCWNLHQDMIQNLVLWSGMNATFLFSKLSMKVLWQQYWNTEMLLWWWNGSHILLDRKPPQISEAAWERRAPLQIPKPPSISKSKIWTKEQLKNECWNWSCMREVLLYKYQRRLCVHNLKVGLQNEWKMSVKSRKLVMTCNDTDTDRDKK